MAQDMKAECIEIAQRIVEKLEKIYWGKLYAIGEPDGEVYDTKKEAIESASEYFDITPEEAEEEYVREATWEDYFYDVLDIKYTVNIHKEYVSCSVCVGWGGPNIYIDTSDCTVNVYWGAEAKAFFSCKIGCAIDEYFETFYNE